VRPILGIGIGAAAPAAFGLVLDLSMLNLGVPGWGWAFILMGIGGVVATVCAAILPADNNSGDLVASEESKTPRP